MARTSNAAIDRPAGMGPSADSLLQENDQRELPFWIGLISMILLLFSLQRD